MLFQVRTLFDVGFTAYLTGYMAFLDQWTLPFCVTCKLTVAWTTLDFMQGCRRTARKLIFGLATRAPTLSLSLYSFIYIHPFSCPVDRSRIAVAYDTSVAYSTLSSYIHVVLSSAFCLGLSISVPSPLPRTYH